MYTSVLLQQWRALRPVTIAVAVLSFVLPLLTVVYQPGSIDSSAAPVAMWLTGARQVGIMLPWLAALYGIFTGISTWAPDISGKFVYALSLPVTRLRFVALRFAAGATLAALPVAALLAGALVARAVITLPEGISAYPVALALRFGMATVTCFALVFATAAAGKRFVYSLLGALVGLIALDAVLNAFSVNADLTGGVGRLLINWPGPLSILGGRWSLFDV